MKLGEGKVSRDVLIVDNELDACKNLKEFLEQVAEFRNIVFSHDGKDATLRLSRQSFSLVILDLNLEKKDGVQVIQSMKKGQLNKFENILIFSSNVDREKIQELLRYGVRNFLVKPFDKKIFTEKVLQMLGQ